MLRASSSSAAVRGPARPTKVPSAVVARPRATLLQRRSPVAAPLPPAHAIGGWGGGNGGGSSGGGGGSGGGGRGLKKGARVNGTRIQKVCFY